MSFAGFCRHFSASSVELLEGQQAMTLQIGNDAESLC